MSQPANTSNAQTDNPTSDQISQVQKIDKTQTQKEQTQPSGFARGFLNVLLVFLESAITLVLRFDPALRKLAYPLASSDKVVCIRTYLPHTHIYATFGYRGVLLDDRLPAGKEAADMTINAYSFQLVNVLTTHNQSAVDALQIRGETEDVAQLKAFLLQLGVGGVVQNLLQMIRGKQQKPTPEEKQQKQENYKAKIAEQSAQIQTLTTENHKLSTALQEWQSKQQSTQKALIVVSIVALLAIVANFIW